MILVGNLLRKELGDGIFHLQNRDPKGCVGQFDNGKMLYSVFTFESGVLGGKLTDKDARFTSVRVKHADDPIWVDKDWRVYDTDPKWDWAKE